MSAHTHTHAHTHTQRLWRLLVILNLALSYVIWLYHGMLGLELGLTFGDVHVSFYISLFYVD